MNRRQFTYLGASYCLVPCCPFGALAADNKTTIGGEFFLLQKNGQWGVRAENLTIDGLSFPKFSWQWIGMGLAQGVLSFIGGALFSALANAIFGGTSPHISIEQLLQQQLEEFAQIVDDAVTQNEVRRYWADSRAYFELYREYLNTPSKDSLESIRRTSAVALSNLESLGFPGYRAYLSAASLRLTILQEAVRRRLATLKDYEGQTEAAIAHHNEIVAYINQQTEPSTFVPPGSNFTNHFSQDMISGKGKWYFDAVIIHGKILGVPIGDGIVPMRPDHTPFKVEDVTWIKPLVVPDNRYVADRIVDWQYIRTKAKTENTDLGERWTAALKKMRQKHNLRSK